MNRSQLRFTMRRDVIAFSARSICILLIAGFSRTSVAQNIAINTDGSRADANAILDIKSFNKGLLLPRMSSEQRMKIPNTQGLMVYDINTNSFWYNTGRQWNNMSPALAATGAWLVTGNAGTDNTNFLGTTDNAMLNFRVNNQQSGRIDHTLNNTFWGFRSGFSITTGNDNTGTGASALFHNTTGASNTAAGSNALQTNSTGFFNSGFGRFALMSNTTGYNNTAAGAGALFSNTTGIDNVAHGTNALYSNTIGRFNVAVGKDALYYNTNGELNTANGFNSQYSNQTGKFNTAIGAFSLQSNKIGDRNTAMGYGALNFSISLPAENTVSEIANSHINTRNNLSEIMDAAYQKASSIRRSGFIAQEVEEAAKKVGYNFSGIVAPGKEQQHYGLSYDAFVVPLVKAMQEQQQMIKELQREIAELKKLLIQK